MVEGLNRTEVLIVYAVAMVILAFVIWAWAKIFTKAGYSPLLAILMMIPVVGLITFLWFAFSRWPILRQTDSASHPPGYRAA